MLKNVKVEIEVIDLDIAINALNELVADRENHEILFGLKEQTNDKTETIRSIIRQFRAVRREEWREIPEFEAYEMKRDGTVRDAVTKEIVRPHFNMVHQGKFYNLATEAGDMLIHVDSFRKVTFPEAK